MSCRSVREWLHRESESLDETQQLLLDDHLAACERCRSDREHLQLLRRAGTSLTAPPPGARDYTRAIARALLEGNTRRSSARPAGTWMAPVSIAAIAAAAVIAFVVLTRTTEDAAPRAAHQDMPVPPPTPMPPPAPAPNPPRSPPPSEETDMVEHGTLALGANTIARGDAIPADAPLRAMRDARVRLAAMRVVLAANSQIRWSPIVRTLLLDRGSIDIDADATDRAAHVVTPAFDVEISDAALTVDPSKVRVRRGAARIVDRKGKLLAHLEAEGTWELSRTAAIQKPAPATHDNTTTELLALARDEFVAKRYDAAERLAERALVIAASRKDEVDAQIFLADVAQASGELELAVTRYEAVATNFAELPAAESALYAAARLELRRGRASAAQILLDLYLDRYPSGRYADDVRRQRTSPP